MSLFCQKTITTFPLILSLCDSSDRTHYSNYNNDDYNQNYISKWITAVCRGAFLISKQDFLLEEWLSLIYNCDDCYIFKHHILRKAFWKQIGVSVIQLACSRSCVCRRWFDINIYHVYIYIYIYGIEWYIWYNHLYIYMVDIRDIIHGSRLPIILN